jgi:predicted metal-dependent hydrolase
MTFDWASGPLAEGLRCYNSAGFFAAHEHWESIWLTAPHHEKRFLQALIQVTVAMHHFTRSNLLGTTRLLTAALGKLEPHPSEFGSLNITLLRDDITSCLQILSTQPDPQLTPPRIQPTNSGAP